MNEDFFPNCITLSDYKYLNCVSHEVSVYIKVIILLICDYMAYNEYYNGKPGEKNLLNCVICWKVEIVVVITLPIHTITRFIIKSVSFGKFLSWNSSQNM